VDTYLHSPIRLHGGFLVKHNFIKYIKIFDTGTADAGVAGS